MAATAFVSAQASGAAMSGKAHQVSKAPRAGSVWVNCYQAMDPLGIAYRRAAFFGRPMSLRSASSSLRAAVAALRSILR